MFSLFWSSHVEKEKLEMATVSTLFLLFHLTLLVKIIRVNFGQNANMDMQLDFYSFFFC